MRGLIQLSIAALAGATAISVNRRETPLSVELTASGNSEVKIAITNNGETALNLLSTGTFLDEVNPVEKVKMFAAGSKFIYFLVFERTHILHYT